MSFSELKSLGIANGTLTLRLPELSKKYGWIQPELEETEKGSPIVVYRLTPDGRDLVESLKLHKFYEKTVRPVKA